MSEPSRIGHQSNREKRKLAFRARHRLHSIDRDAVNLKQNQRAAPLSSFQFPIIPNKHCGAWYLSSRNDVEAAAHFKSTDGHVGTYNFSLKRLNLPLVQLLSQRGGCVLVDSSTRKTLPDSFSRTIPIWCCVLNRIVRRYRKDMSTREELNDDWDDGLHTPASLVSPEEHARILALIGERVEMLWRSRAIVDPRGLVETLTKPLRAVWVVNNELSECSSHQFEKYFTLVCCNPSVQSLDSKNHVEWVGDDVAGYYYSPGAADDESAWARNLTPELFWSNRDALLDTRLTDDQVDCTIDWIVQHNRHFPDDTAKQSSDKIGNMNLFVGSRKAGRPPECFTKFDCILNVTENEYAGMRDVINRRSDEHKRHYLQLPVLEGKRDKTELERWMPIALIFIAKHIREGRKVLVHCAQGKDRSIGIVLAFVCIFCRLEYPLQIKIKNECFDGIEQMIHNHEEDNDVDSNGMYLLSGLRGATVRRLLREDGREVFLEAIHRHLSLPTEPLATKERLRIAHHLVSQDREQAEPTRSTFQKLNRFFMSSTLYRTRDPSAT